MESAMKEKPPAEKKKPENFKQDERGQTHPANREQAQREEQP